MRISVTFYDSTGAIFSVCNIIAADNTKASIDAAVSAQWTDAAIAAADVLTAPGRVGYSYAAKP